MEKLPKRRLRNLLINPAYQLKYTLLITVSALLLTLINGAIAYFYIRENYLMLVDISPITDDVKAQLYSELWRIAIYISLASLGFLIFVGIIGIVLSHRTAGPMVNFKRVFSEIKSGRVNSRVRLRANDDFADVAAAFNEMMDSVQRKP